MAILIKVNIGSESLPLVNEDQNLKYKLTDMFETPPTFYGQIQRILLATAMHT